MSSRILIVDDEESIRFTFEAFLVDEGYEVSTAMDLDGGLKLLEGEPFDLVFLDILLGRDNGLDALKACREKHPNLPVVMITGSPEIETAAEAVRYGAFDYIPKPVRQETLLRVAKMALQYKALLDQKERYRARLDAIFRSVREGIVTLDRELRVLEFNQSAASLFGWGKEVTGRPFEQVWKGDCTNCLEKLRQVVETGITREAMRVECAPGGKQHKVLSVASAPLLGEQGGRDGVVLTVRDETRLETLERDLKERQSFDRIIGRSPTMQQLYDLIDNLSQVDTTVLITGESGTGKELVAESLHYRGPRKGKPLIRVNCAALPENLLESELFGHIKGAFTGAVTDKTGRFQRADGGTIFLDEIGDISPALQVRLLRVLQEKEIEKVGGTTPIKVDIRVVAATHQDLLEKVRRGEFREDLYYRLKVMTLPLPALRERREDIPLLINFFVKRFNERFGKQVVGISAEVLDLFMQHPWPGNVRELEHAVEHAFILCRGEQLEREHLPTDILEVSESQQDENGSALDREQLEQALEKAAGNKTLAAQILGISRRTIYRKLEEFAIE